MAQKPLVLAVETSSRVGSAALARGPVLLAETTFSAPLRHSSEMFPAVSTLLDRFGHRPPDVAQVHISIGPGSFTGLRIAVTMAKTMHLANRIAIVTVGSLDTIAANTVDVPSWRSLQNTVMGGATGRLAVVLDAKRGQFFAAVYQRVPPSPQRTRRRSASDESYTIPAPADGCWRKVLPDCLITAADLIERFVGAGPLCVSGDGLLYRRDEFAADGVHILDQGCWSPRASRVHALGWQKAQAGLFADPQQLVPFYLRGPQLTIRTRQTQASQ